MEYILKFYDLMVVFEIFGKVYGFFDKIEENEELLDLMDEELEVLIIE